MSTLMHIGKSLRKIFPGSLASLKANLNQEDLETALYYKERTRRPRRLTFGRMKKIIIIRNLVKNFYQDNCKVPFVLSYNRILPKSKIPILLFPKKQFQLRKLYLLHSSKVNHRFVMISRKCLDWVGFVKLGQPNLNTQGIGLMQ